MKQHICCYSGGHSSGLVAIEVVRRYGKDNVVLLNHDIAVVSESLDIKRSIQKTDEIGIAPPSTYGIFKHANCIGCLKAGRQHWYCVFCLRPDRWERGKEAEDEIGYTIIKGTSLEELEPMFNQMRAAGIEPTEHIPAATFWAAVKKKLRTISVIPEQESLPCECSI